MADSTVVPLYNQGHPYRRGAISPDGDRTDWFAVAPPVLREMVSALDRRRADDYDHLFPIPSVPATAATFLAQRYVFHHLHSGGPPDPLYVEEAVLTTLTDVLERAFGTRDLAESSLTHHRLAQRAREHLNRTYLRKESVADVAAAVGTSVFHLCRVFRRETGTSLHAYRTDLRLRRSLEWLHDRADILTVALGAGFVHHSHFTAAFRRAFGTCPSEFRAGESPRIAFPERGRTAPLQAPRYRRRGRAAAGIAAVERRGVIVARGGATSDDRVSDPDLANRSRTSLNIPGNRESTPRRFQFLSVRSN